MNDAMTDSRTCTNCGAVVPEGHHYCGQCGANFHQPGEDQTLYYGAMMAPGKAKLVLIRGEGLEGLSYHLNATEHIAGREQGAVLFPDDVYLSPEHATFFYRDNELFVRDEESQNGTFFRIRKPVRLGDGAEIRVGDQMFQIEFLDIEQDYPRIDDTLMYISPPKPYKFRLIHLIEDGKAGAAYCSPDNTLTIGRENCDITIPGDPYLSSTHARLSWDKQGVVIEDNNTKNGVFTRINHSQKLQHGDYVFVGEELLRVEINE